MARKARNGAGSSYEYKNRPKHSNSRWRHQRRITLPNGTKKRVEGYGKSEREAVKNCEKKIQEAIEIISPSQTLEKFCDYYLDILEAQIGVGGIKPSTYINNSSVIENHIKGTIIAPIPLNQIQPHHIQEWHTNNLKSKKPAAIIKALRVIKSVFFKAVDLGKLEKSPVPRNLKAPENKPDISIWTEEECKRFLDVASGDRLYALYYLAISTGMRRGEVLGLRWQDVSFAEKIISINHSLMFVSKKNLKIVKAAQGVIQLSNTLFLIKPKTKGSCRDILLPDTALNILLEHKTSQQEAANNRIEANKAYKDNDLVFTLGSGQPISPSNLREYYLALQKRAGVPHARFHDLRDLHASLLLSKGIDIAAISERLGHTRTSMTFDRYVRVVHSARQRAAMPIEELLD